MRNIKILGGKKEKFAFLTVTDFKYIYLTLTVDFKVVAVI